MAKAKDDSTIWATGRRKTAVARVRVKPGTGKILINKRAFKEYFPTQQEGQRVLAPLKCAGVEKSVDVAITLHGGGYSGQSGAVSMGIARALLKSSEEHESSLREGKFLTRDSRQKERKKYGRRGARRGFQFSKR
jgi:small subunit ribosomal protein S9